MLQEVITVVVAVTKTVNARFKKRILYFSFKVTKFLVFDRIGLVVYIFSHILFIQLQGA